MTTSVVCSVMFEAVVRTPKVPMFYVTDVTGSDNDKHESKSTTVPGALVET